MATEEIFEELVNEGKDSTICGKALRRTFPFDCSITIPRKLNSVQAGASLRTQLLQKAKDFGADHVHIVAHSNGGVYTRAMLAGFNDANLGVYSVTSMDTPHWGSALADAAVAAHHRKLSALFDVAELASFFTDYDLETEASTTFDMRRTNEKLGAPPATTKVTTNGRTATDTVQYYYTAANADRNGNWQIDSASEPSPTGCSSLNPSAPGCDVRNMTEGYPYSFKANRLYQYLRTVRHVALCDVPEATAKCPPGHSLFWPSTVNTSNQANDLVTTTVNAQYDNFNFFPDPNTGSYWGLNHSQVGSAPVAIEVLKRIKQAQPMQ